MFKNLARASLLVLAATLGPPSPAQTPPLKVGFVYVSPVGEAGWTFQHDQGRRAMEKALAGRVQTTVVESVAEGADSERVMRDLVQQGCGLVFATSFGYLEPALRVAADFPQVKFEQTGGYKTAANLNTYNARYYEARYLAGWLAGKASRSGIAGYVAGFPVPEVVQGIDAFTIGMREANPKAQVRVLWLNTWFDPAREREAAQSLIDQGADVLTNHSGSPAVPQAAQAAFNSKGVRVIAYQSDMRAYAPDAQLAAVVQNWGGYYTEVARTVIEGRWKAQPVWGGIKDGLVDLGGFDPSLPKAWTAELARKRQAIVDGRLKPFGTLDDKDIASLNRLVPGVVGTLPGR